MLGKSETAVAGGLRDGHSVSHASGNAQLSKRGLTGEQEVRVIDGGLRLVWRSSMECHGTRSLPGGQPAIDIVDAKTSELVCRALCGTRIDDFRNRHKEISEVVKKPIQKFPPKRK